ALSVDRSRPGPQGHPGSVNVEDFERPEIEAILGFQLLFEGDLDRACRSAEIHEVFQYLGPVVIVSAPIRVIDPARVDSAAPERVPLAAVHRIDVPGGRLKGSVDRKSTRLNSSHDQISYAVFCL